LAYAAAKGDGVSHSRSLGDRDCDDLVVGLRGLTLT
jgi:hypothetical protein